MKPTSYLVAASTAALLFCGGCASAPPPTQLFLDADQALKKAAENGAEQYAPLELHTGQDKLEKSKAAKKDHPKRSRRLVEEALIDAELADVTSSAAKAQKAKEEIHKSIDALEQETKRTP